MSEKVSVLFAIPVGGVDDAAIEETQRAIDAQSYPQALIEVVRIEYVSQALGAHAAALNAAREGATGEWIVHVEPGVVWDSNKLERQIRQVRADPSLDGCVHQMTRRLESGRSVSAGFASIKTYGFQIGCLLHAPWGLGAAMVSREATIRAGAYRSVDEVLWEYAIRLIHRGLRLGMIDDDLAIWHTDVATRLGKVEGRRVLVPEGVRHRFLKSYVDRCGLETLFSDLSLVSEPDGHLVLAGLHHSNDDLETSHAICQAVGSNSKAANYWHGVMHRREPDFDNARGWFERAEGLEALQQIRGEVGRVLQQVLQVPDYGEAREDALLMFRHLQDRGTWDPFYFLDLCEVHRVKQGSGKLGRLLEEIQEAEFRALFDWTFRQAVGRNDL